MLTDPGTPHGAAPVPVLGRREFLRRSGVIVLASPLLSVSSGTGVAATAPRVSPLTELKVRPREEWGSDLPPRGPLERERAEDVRFLLVHHTATANNYGRGEVPGLIRDVYAFHTGRQKNWADVTYNFLVDRYGGVWEGRKPVRPGQGRRDRRQPGLRAVVLLHR